VEYLFGTMGIVIVFKIGPNAYKMYTIIFSYQKTCLCYVRCYYEL
jgi:hypothetical protein